LILPPLMSLDHEDNNLLTMGLAQIAPVWLDQKRTLEKVESYVLQVAEQGCHLVVFGEALVPGYPFGLELTDGAPFNSRLQKTMFLSMPLNPCSRKPYTSTEFARSARNVALPRIWHVLKSP
jgi:hypothetical protein